MPYRPLGPRVSQALSRFGDNFQPTGQGGYDPLARRMFGPGEAPIHSYTPDGSQPWGVTSAIPSRGPVQIPIGYEEELGVQPPIGYGEELGVQPPIGSQTTLPPSVQPPSTLPYPPPRRPQVSQQAGGLPPQVNMSGPIPAGPQVDMSGPIHTPAGTTPAGNAYAAQLEKLMGEFLNAPEQEELTEKDKRAQWLRAGLATMQAAGQRGSTALGSIGAGGVAAMNYGDKLRAQRASTRTANLGRALDTTELLARYQDLRDQRTHASGESRADRASTEGIARSDRAVDAYEATTGRISAHNDTAANNETRANNRAELIISGQEIQQNERVIRNEAGARVGEFSTTLKKQISEDPTAPDRTPQELDDYVDSRAIQQFGADSEQGRHIGRARIVKRFKSIQEQLKTNMITQDQFDAQKAIITQQMNMINDGLGEYFVRHER